ncbi:hypothetical protein D3C85_1747910 [compost metagenome]
MLHGIPGKIAKQAARNEFDFRQFSGFKLVFKIGDFINQILTFGNFNSAIREIRFQA